ncbi:hypothetical protein SAMN03159343_4083 [Klenkia marina]|uniref:Helix-turn-helix domain-containing protein n=1 Tax=Klenkia marina TaxID=1960309 RepID=A0A1G4Z519_9ACTN|nr:hypothetical protein SAMN03159343_4083 [Klenkia marina]
MSVGIRPTAGATAGLPAWWGATDWVESEVRDALAEHRDVCRAHHVEADTALAVARGMAAYADFNTGRDCRPTNARLVADLRVSLSTVHRARRVLKALGLVVELVAGRSIMTRNERLAAWRRGSSHRQIAAEFALCSRRLRPRGARPTATGPGGGRAAFRRPAASTGPVTRSRSRLHLVDDDTPPSALPERLSSHLRTTHLQAKAEQKKAAPRPAPTRRVDQDQAERRLRVVRTPAEGLTGLPTGAEGPPPRATGPDPRTRRLADSVARRLGWLRGTSPRRLAPTLHRFATAGWTPRDVERAVADALASRGWRLPRDIQQPAAYLATLLRALDPEDRPGELDSHMAQVEEAQRIYERLLVFGRPCPHGTPAGDRPSPLRGLLACPSCRTAIGNQP